MLRANLLCMAVIASCAAVFATQDDTKLQSGPKKGADIPAPFECYNINGAAKDRPHCLVCKFGLRPSVLIFAREPADGKDAAFNELVTKLDEMATEFQERSFFVGVVFLSPDARDSTNNVEEKDADKIIKEAVKRQELYARLGKRAEKLKNVIVACYPQDGPKKYEINPKADLTILFYNRMKILENFAFASDSLGAKDVETVLGRIRTGLAPPKKGTKG